MSVRYRSTTQGAEMREAGVPASVSHGAGTCVCNPVFCGLMHRLQQQPGRRGSFMHLPYLPEQAAARFITGVR